MDNTEFENAPVQQDNNGYNGWSNYETWNVALWIDNEEALYKLARSLRYRQFPYVDFARHMFEAGSVSTPDGVLWADPEVDTNELDRMISEL